MSLSKTEKESLMELCVFFSIDKFATKSIESKLKTFEEHFKQSPSDKCQRVITLMVSLKKRSESLLKTFEREEYSYEDIYVDLLPIIYSKLTFNLMSDENKQLDDRKLDREIQDMFSHTLSKFLLLYVFVKIVESSSKDNENIDIYSILDSFGGDTNVK